MFMSTKNYVPKIAPVKMNSNPIPTFNFFRSITNYVLRCLGVLFLLCIFELSRLTCVEKAVKNTTIFVIYKVLVYIQMSQPTTCFGLF